MKQASNQGEDGAVVYADIRNITIGRGRILWGTATHTSRGEIVEEGWVLPGGHRTRSREVAEAFARWITANTSR